MIDLDKMQKEVYQNKLDKGFDASDTKENLYRQFCLINGEVAEAFEAYTKKFDTLGEELADICLYVLGMCEIRGISLEKELVRKLDIIKKRTYEKIDGVFYKDGDRRK